LLVIDSISVEGENMRKTTLLAGVLIIATSVAASAAQTAEKKMHACALLTSSEVVAAVGGTGKFQETDMVIPAGPSKGETMGGCMWAADNEGMVSVSMIRAAQGAQREAGLAKLNEAFQRLKARGWTEEKKDFTKARCALMTPPSSSEKSLPVMTGCFAEAKGMGISVGYMGRTSEPIEKVKTLLDKAIGRLP
jgi:hypothetical protein